jgi:hypothetical protein
MNKMKYVVLGLQCPIYFWKIVIELEAFVYKILTVKSLFKVPLGSIGLGESELDEM